MTPTAAATVWGTSPGSAMGARSTNQLPSACDASDRAAISTARRVLPEPAGPVRVTRRSASSSFDISRSSRSRPMNVLSGAGRLLGGRSAVVGDHTTSRSAGTEPCSSFSSDR